MKVQIILTYIVTGDVDKAAEYLKHRYSLNKGRLEAISTGFYEIVCPHPEPKVTIKHRQSKISSKINECQKTGQ
ncbi:MAG TPA: hypothetical protein VNX68_13750 [Nitrosopumilaceae archaeon]|jgi:hypothetical protein|nr:hypothetical protein [Nitrosopumilaceae archaeon]